jgi:hypothetical protein
MSHAVRMAGEGEEFIRGWKARLKHVPGPGERKKAANARRGCGTDDESRTASPGGTQEGSRG